MVKLFGGIKMANEQGADAHDATDFANNAGAFKSDGYGFVGQYIDQYSDANTAGSASVTKGQIGQEMGAGLSIVSIFQTNGMSSSTGSAYQTYFNAAQGMHDANEAVASAQALGQPQGSAIYFAMDFDPGGAGETNLLAQVRTYLAAVDTVLQAAGYNVGVYGAGDTLAAAVRPASPDQPVAQYGWLTQSYAWAGSNAVPHDPPYQTPDANAQNWNIYQYFQPSNDPTPHGVAIDPDTSMTADFGTWGGGTTAAPTPLTFGEGNSDLTITTSISDLNGVASVVKIGTGTLTLATSSTYSGGTFVDGGTIAISTDVDLGLPSGPLTLAGGTLETTASVLTTRHVVLNDGTGGAPDTLQVDSGTTFTLLGSVSGSAPLVKTGTGTLTLSGSNTYSGGTVIDSGTVAVIQDANLGKTSGGLTLAGGTLEATNSFSSARALTLNTGAGGTADNVQVDSGKTLTLTGIVSGSAPLVTNGTGTLILSGTNTYSGGTVIGGGGTLAVASDANLGKTSGGLTLSGGTLEATASFSSARAVTLNNGLVGAPDSVQVDPGATLTLTGIVSGTALVKIGSGTLTLSGTNTYANYTAINEGTLAVASDANLGKASGYLNLTGATLETTASFSSARAVTLSYRNGGPADTLQVDPGTTLSLSGVVSGAAPLLKTGTGALRLSGANTYQGATTISAGTLALTGSGSIAQSAGLSVAANATFDISGETAATINKLSGVAGSTINLGAGTLTVVQNAASTFAGVIQDGSSGNVGGSLVVSGSAPLTLTGVSTYTGKTSVSGTLALAGTGSVHSSSKVALTTSGATFDISGATAGEVVNKLGGTAGTFAKLGNQTLKIKVQGGAVDTFSGTIRDGGIAGGTGGSLTLGGTGELNLTGAETYTGATTLAAGTLALTGSGSIAASKSLSLQSSLGFNSTFDISGETAASIGTLSGVAGSLVDLGAGTLTVNEATANTFAGVIRDGGLSGGAGGNLAVAGSAALTLTSVETYTGKTSVSGTLDLSGSASIHSSTKVALTKAGATFDISGASATEVVNKLGGVTGSVTDLGAQNLKIKVQSGTVDTYAGTIKDGGIAGGSGGSLTLGGLGELSLTHANTYSGGTTIDAGTLDLAALGAAGSGTITFANPAGNGVATLEIDAAALSGGNGAYSFANAIAGAASTNQVIDLRSLAYVQGSTTATLVNSTSLVVADGSSAVTLTLASSSSKSSFTTASDGHGGTLVYDPPATMHTPATAKIDTRWIEMAMADFGGVTGDAHAHTATHDVYGMAATAAFEHHHGHLDKAIRGA